MIVGLCARGYPSGSLAWPRERVHARGKGNKQGGGITSIANLLLLLLPLRCWEQVEGWLASKRSAEELLVAKVLREQLSSLTAL